MATTKKQSVVICSDANLVKELEDVVKLLRSKKIKAIIFNHKNTSYQNRGLALYNVEKRSAVTLGKTRDTDFSIANDTILNESRLRAIQDVAKEEDILKHKDVYAIIDDNNDFKCIESQFNKHMEFDKASEDCLTIYYNEFNDQNNLPKYLVREKENQYKLCSNCHKLILDELDSAQINSEDYCYDCIVKLDKQDYVDANRLKLMQLHRLEAED